LKNDPIVLRSAVKSETPPTPNDETSGLENNEEDAPLIKPLIVLRQMTGSAMYVFNLE
jgi:hypothetical protein